MSPRTRAWISAVAGSLALAALIASPASAQVHLIGPGQEQAVLELLSPHALGAEVADEYMLWNIAIERDRVVVTVRRRDGAEGRITLLHPDDAPDDAARTESFAIVEDGDESARAARRALILAVRQNDRGGFWPRARSTVTGGGTGAPPPPSWRLALFGAPGWVPIDGVLVILLVYLLALALAVRLLVRAPRWMGPALASITLAGVLVRIALSPPMFLGAWPWSRLYPHVRAVADGRWIDAVGDLIGAPAIYLTDVMLWTNFAYAIAMPLVAFSHATYLLKSPRAGLGAAFVIAFLPQHIRFSRCEDGFIASLVMTSLAFALIHGFLRDRSRVARWAWILALPLILYPGYQLRPLNVFFAPVYVIAILGLHRETAPLARRALALAIVIGIASVSALELVQHNPEATATAASRLDWLANVFRVLASPRLLVLSDPSRTPPILMLMAIAGAVLAWRSGQRRLVLFLIGWLLVFVVLHGFVVQETMQPRYHLHLVVPFVLLASCAVPRLARKRAPWLALAAIVMAASPWIHRGFIEDVSYTEMREYAFVRRARELVPPGCTVLENTGGPYEVDELRFSRIGTIVGRRPRSRFRAIGVFPDGRTSPGQPALDEILQDPPSCLYLYEGLACSTFRAPNETYARQCGELFMRLRAEPILEDSAPVRLYDAAVARDRPLEIERVPFRLSRAGLD